MVLKILYTQSECKIVCITSLKVLLPFAMSDITHLAYGFGVLETYSLMTNHNKNPQQRIGNNHTLDWMIKIRKVNLSGLMDQMLFSQDLILLAQISVSYFNKIWFISSNHHKVYFKELILSCYLNIFTSYQI